MAYKKSKKIKSSFCAYEAEFLGFVLTRQGVKPQVKKVQAVLKIEPPKTVKQVRSFIGMINYYKDHIPKRSELLSPLTTLTKKGARFKWTDECQQNFEKLKQLLAKQVVLAYPDFSLPFEIYTDASNKQIGAVLQQKGRPLAFYSRKLNDAQTRYTVIELELLAIVETLQEYRTILLGHIIKIFTDHKNLTFANFTTDRVRRWRLIVEEYGPEIVYLPGATNIVADFLSRHPTNMEPSSELFLLDELFNADDDDFPLAYETISTHQQADTALQAIVRANASYDQRIINRSPLIYLNGKIVVPKSLQRRIIDWYHTMLAHPGETRTLKTISQHFVWQSLHRDVQKFVSTCATCQHYKRQRKNYGHVPVKQHQELEPWTEVHVDLIGPWIIPQRPSKTPKTSDSKPSEPLKVLALTMIDPATTLLELIAIPDKESRTTARAFDRSWLCRYPRPTVCLHDKGTEFTGFEFQELLQSYGIRSRASSTANPQSNSILERTHQVIANQLRSLILMSIKLKSLADIQHELLAPVQWAMNATYHTTLQATAGQLAFQRDMILPTSFLAHWQNIRQRRQTHTDRDTARENQRRIPYRYSVGDLVLIRQPAQGKLAKPTRGPFHIIDVSRQHVNGTVLVDLNHSQESFNIRRLIPFQRRQPH
jgi:transposase InsO family protein